jgi:hypothetical protein
MHVRRVVAGVVVCAITVTGISTGFAGASTAPQAAASKAKTRHRTGGKVRLAWPYTKKGRPSDPLGRWLARQAGPVCSKSRKKKHKRCSKLRAKHNRGGRKSKSLAVPSVDRGPKRLDSSPVATISSPVARAAALATPLALTRSYQIPSGDPSYNRLLNWSWTYDSALTAASFVAQGNQSQAKQLLDQLAALQYMDGSIDIAFDVATGQGAGMYRAGTIAWIGLAATKYDSRFGVSTYRTMAKKAADYLLTLQGTDGLIRGGPGLPWYSTQHNLLAYVFLGHLAVELQVAGDASGFQKYGAAAFAIGNAIEDDLITGSSSSTHFIQGLGDATVPFDVQVLGALFEEVSGHHSTATHVLNYAKNNFGVSGRSVVKSTNVATYNNTYQASGPFSGYKPYLGSNGPDILWFEATPMLRLATSVIGGSTNTLDSWITAWKAITGTSGPLQANQTLTNETFGVDYHVWPAAAPAAWVILAQQAPTFLTSY